MSIEVFMTPEQDARLLVDERLKRAGWDVQDYKDIN
jgi:type I site-specific restriction endonuclease